MMNGNLAATSSFETLFKVASENEASFMRFEAKTDRKKMNYKRCAEAKHMSGFTVNILPLYFR